MYCLRHIIVFFPCGGAEYSYCPSMMGITLMEDFEGSEADNIGSGESLGFSPY